MDNTYIIFLGMGDRGVLSGALAKSVDTHGLTPVALVK